MELQHKQIVVTGGAGFIGSHLTETLVSLGCHVTVIDDLSRGKLKNIAPVSDKIHFFQLDLRNEQACISVFEHMNIVFNLAALNTGVDYDQGRTERMFEENMLLQLIPIRAAHKAHVQKFIQISSASVYSTDAMEKRVPTKETDDGDEPENSKLGYALAKRMGEKLARWYANDTDMQTCSARFINVYGTKDNTDMLGHFIPTMIRKMRDSEKTVEIFGSGNQCRSFLHVDDAVSALIRLATKGKNGEVYNIDPQDEHSIKEIVLTLQKIMGKQDVEIVFNTSLPEGSKRRMLDNTKIKSLGWNPIHTLLTSLPELVHEIVESS
jgi:nucleoside-diphosphate-sugar epimerase